MGAGPDSFFDLLSKIPQRSPLPGARGKGARSAGASATNPCGVRRASGSRFTSRLLSFPSLLCCFFVCPRARDRSLAGPRRRAAAWFTRARRAAAGCAGALVCVLFPETALGIVAVKPISAERYEVILKCVCPNRTRWSKRSPVKGSRSPRTDIKTRLRGSETVPYVAHPFRVRETGAIHEIVGPAAPADAEEQVEHMLRSHGLASGVRITRSKIPYRG